MRLALRSKLPTLLAILLITLSTSLVIYTATRLSRTADETYHSYCGAQWWQTGNYTIEPKHPPLARVMATAPFYFANISWPTSMEALPGMSPEASYRYKTLLMRLGTLPFYVLSCWVVFSWSRQLFGASAAMASLLLYILLPIVTAHAGIAATDMGCAAMISWALYNTVRWLKHPRSNTSCWLGLSLGLMIGVKFSALVQYPAAMLLILCASGYENYRQHTPLSPLKMPHLRSLAFVLPCMLVTLAAIYRFSFSALIQGIIDIKHMNDHGFAIWLFKPLRNHSVWYFFPVVFFFKTPLPFHCFAILGNAQLITKNIKKPTTEQLFPLLAAIGIMLASMPSHINLGVRHVLTLYSLLAIPAGYGLASLWRRHALGRLLGIVLILWQAISFWQASPDYLAYYNELAGAHPEHISLDSDFDWGQDVILLNEALERSNITEVHLCLRTLHTMVSNSRFLLHARALDCPRAEATGWLALSKSTALLESEHFAWLKPYKPVQTVGKTIDLYYIP